MPRKKPTKPLPARTFEQRVIQATLDFANLDGVSSTLEVESLFAQFTPAIAVYSAGTNERIGEVRPFRSRGTPSGKGAFQTAWTRPKLPERHGVDTYRRYQRTVRGALDHIIDLESFPMPDLSDQLNSVLGRERPVTLGVADERLCYTFSIRSVQAGYALGLALLLGSDHARHLKRCEGCEAYFVIFHPKRRRQKYCDQCGEDARRKSAADRQGAWRAGISVAEYRKRKQRDK